MHHQCQIRTHIKGENKVLQKEHIINNTHLFHNIGLEGCPFSYSFCCNAFALFFILTPHMFASFPLFTLHTLNKDCTPSYSLFSLPLEVNDLSSDFFSLSEFSSLVFNMCFIVITVIICRFKRLHIFGHQMAPQRTQLKSPK